MKYDIRKHNFKDLIKKSEEYKKYINSQEILDLEMAIDRELLNLERSAKAFKILAYELKNDLIKPKNQEKETLKIENLEKETLNENTNFKNEIQDLNKVFENIKENIEYYQEFDR
ncbi:hypothetical protein [Aliarcobacter butzleri]|uniref:hypothetical protein n=1 Tax=Aliarcobacter butzleri TaxID=28197 RepID=UPI002B253082|nr:hypothetical protein [Aliarcobacter butzleri]